MAERGGTPGAVVYYDGFVYAGIAGGESGVRGQFGAYDAKTGKEVWKFFTIPGPGEFGNDTWEGDSWMRGGGPLWTHPAIDPDLGLVYLPVGNAYPDVDGGPRGGDNLFTASIVALDLKTGVRKWHFQEVHHDIWDYDNQTPPVLADVRYRGQFRKILIHGGKTGLMYILDRTDGRALIGIEERPVPQEPRQKTAKTQPFPIGDSIVPTCPEPGSVEPGWRVDCLFAAYWADSPVVTTPGTQGGLNWAPMAFSPFDESRLRAGLDHQLPVWSALLTAARPAALRSPRRARSDDEQDRMGEADEVPAGHRQRLARHGERPDLPRRIGRPRPRVYDLRNGDTLWKFQTSTVADAPVATYEVGGQQYVAILAGGNPFQLSAHGAIISGRSTSMGRSRRCRRRRNRRRRSRGQDGGNKKREVRSEGRGKFGVKSA